MLWIFDSFWRWSLRVFTRGFEKPVLFIVGKNDSVINFETSLRMVSLSDCSQICVLNNSAHMGMIEESEGSYFEIVSWLDWIYNRVEISQNHSVMN
ncbi:MAG: alpha/beta hydrolase [Ignavibacteria bacterium]|nr:alpha/beta hydrolase [Ignavibacteria bacterium]